MRDGLEEMINDAAGYLCVGAFESAEAALAEIPKLNVDVALLDIKLPGMSGIACIAGLAAVAPDLEMMMLTVFEDHDLIFQSLRTGATGYLLKHTPRAKLLEAISELHQGGAPMSPEIARLVVKGLQKADPALKAIAPLSPREKEICEQLARGLTNKEIADVCGISVETIRTHIHNIYKKLHVRSRTEAVMKVYGRLPQ